MEEIRTYTDCRNKPTELTCEQIRWFHAIANRCKRAAGVQVDIIAYDHELYRGKSKDALGCCHTENPDNPLAEGANSFITIDCYFINEQWGVTFNDDFNISGDTLEHVIAHEIAHLFIWRHGKKHTALTESIYEKFQDKAA